MRYFHWRVIDYLWCRHKWKVTTELWYFGKKINLWECRKCGFIYRETTKER